MVFFSPHPPVPRLATPLSRGVITSFPQFLIFLLTFVTAPRSILGQKINVYMYTCKPLVIHDFCN